MNFIQALNEYVGSLSEAKENDSGGTLLMGDGCLEKSGIPTGDDFFEAIKNRFPQACEGGSAKDIAAVIGKLTDKEKFDLQSQIAASVKLTWSCIAIALMMKEGYIRRVLTTSPYPELQKACALVGLYPGVYDAAATTIDGEKLASTSIIYLNGQTLGASPGDLAPVLSACAGFGPWFVVGYSDQDSDPVFKGLTQVEKFERGLLWVLPNSVAPSRSVHEQILTKGKEVDYTNAEDADNFLVLAMQELKLDVPEVFSFPFSYLGGVLKHISPFPAPGMLGEMRVTDIALHQLKLIVKEYEDAGRGDNLASGDLDMDVLNEPSLRQALQKAQAGLINGDTDLITQQRTVYDKNPNPQLADLLVWAYLKEGDNAYFIALTDKSKAETFFKEARSRYEEALDIRPDGSDIVFKLGKLLAQQARLATGDDAVKLATESGERFQQTIELNPDFRPAHLELGNVLIEKAMHAANSEADGFFAEAIEHFQSVLEAEPENPDAAFGCGIALYRQARKKTSGSDAIPLFSQTVEKLQVIVKLQPNKVEALLPLGHSLVMVSKSKKGKDADDLLAQAIEKFQHAATVKPDMPEGHFGWADALVERSKVHEGDKGPEYLETAVEQYKTTLRLRADMPRAHYRFGIALQHLSRHKSGYESTKMLQQAVEKFQNAVKINAKHVKAYLSMGETFYELGIQKKGKEADKFLTQASEGYEAALNIQPQNANANAQWAEVYLYQGKSLDGPDSDALLEKAIERCKAALESKEDHFKARLVWANALVQMGQNKIDPEVLLFEEAETQYQEAIKQHPDDLELQMGLGNCLLNKARVLEGDQAEAIIDQAIDHVQKVMDADEEAAPALNVMAALLMEQARNKRGINAHPLLAEAKGYLQQAEDKAPGVATYNMARLMAQLANETGCKEWLEKCKANGVLPRLSTLMKDNLLVTVRDSKWFKTLAGGGNGKEDKAG